MLLFLLTVLDNYAVLPSGVVRGVGRKTAGLMALLFRLGSMETHLYSFACAFVGISILGNGIVLLGMVWFV